MKAYIAGVTCSDGYLSDKALGLTAKDKDFVEAFADAVNRNYGRSCKVGRDRKYWRVIYGNIGGTYNDLKNYEPKTKAELAAWLRGFFDGDGNAQLIKIPRGFGRRIAIYNTNLPNLERACLYYSQLGIDAYIRLHQSGPGHKGSLPVYELKLRGSRQNFYLFSKLIGSSIERKRKVIDAIPGSYQPPGHHKRIQLIGSRNKHWNALIRNAPRAILGIRDLIDQGIKPTVRNCQRLIPGYSSIQRYYPQADLIELAEEFLHEND